MTDGSRRTGSPWDRVGREGFGTVLSRALALAGIAGAVGIVHALAADKPIFLERGEQAAPAFTAEGDEAIEPVGMPAISRPDSSDQ
ncbi:MAG: hypothetical protein AAF235_12300, partial [Planctomycetota bacterium]